ncbi:MAG: N-acetylmuramic acid 6-phosphate etherase [Bacteroidetes bacterium]|nr:N-acetylmuramic acid 6-phosphate etherase [Bacteroidota bacterium]
MTRITEQDSHYNHLEKMNTQEILSAINTEDKKVAVAIEKALPSITQLSEAVYAKMRNGGRLFYIGSGTSGRLGIVDASEIPPTYGVDFDLVIGIIAGGDAAIRKAQEGAEDDMAQAWIDLQSFNINTNDFVVGISASGSTPYVLGGLKDARHHSIKTGCIVCNPESAIAAISHHAVEVITGPEFVTGSTRMKAGTAQKLVLNMLTTSVMIRLGKVQGNKMVDMRLSNQKLVERGTKMLMNLYGWDAEIAKEKLLHFGSVRNVILDLEK